MGKIWMRRCDGLPTAAHRRRIYARPGANTRPRRPARERQDNGMYYGTHAGACSQPPHNGVRYTRFALIRNTLQQLRQTVLSDTMSYLAGMAHYYTTDSTIQFRLTLPDGTRLHSDWMLLPLDSKEDVRRLLSLQLTGAWINEIREVPFDIIRPLLGRCGRYPSKAVGGAARRGIIADTNPWDTDS